ncbi:chloride channel protein [Leptospira sp. WS39.C2]
MNQKYYLRCKNYILFLTFWSAVLFCIALVVGSLSAFFLHALDFVSNLREGDPSIIYFLPIAGFVIGWIYYRYGSKANQGNNLLLEEIHSPNSIIPIRMAPFVLFGTLVTHLFGGSAGREGTAVQMGGSIAHQVVRFFPFAQKEHQSLIIFGMSAGFAAVFGTPIAAAIFSIEVIQIGAYRWKLFLPSLMIAWLSHEVCLFWNVKHSLFPEVLFVWDEMIFLSIILLAVSSGIIAKVFTKLLYFLSKLAQNLIKYPPFRPFVGGLVLVILFLSGVGLEYYGLGVNTIQNAFTETLPNETFLWKLLLTSITIGFGFKGGEVTPLFFIGAALGNMFSQIDPTFLTLFVSVGFISVFAGATNTPLACAIMGMELFGFQCGLLFLLVTQISYILSGHTSIYSSQIIAKKKWLHSRSDIGKKISDLSK